MSSSKTNQRLIDTLTVAKDALDMAKEPLDLVPVPGLKTIASVLSDLIGVILVAEGNKKTRAEIAKNIDALASIITETAEMANSVGTDDQTRTRLVNSPELKKRLATLEQDLKNLMKDTTNLETGFLGILLRKKNSDTLSGIKSGIDEARRRFQVQGSITVEMLINGIVDDIKEIKVKQQKELERAEQERVEREKREKRERAEREEREERDLNEKALDKLPHVNATYSSASNPTKSGTLPGTRTAILQEITEWSLRQHTPDDSSFIYVLSGGAGTGKSTIAYEIAHRLEKEGALGASFFFVEGASDFNTTTYVLTTIAYQLAHNQTGLYSHIAKAAREYSRKGKQGEQLQMDLDNLIIKPLKNVEASHHPIILVLDALDECTKAAQGEVTRLLFLFMEQLPKIPFPVRVLVTTRPEMKIEAALNTEEIRQVSKPFRLHEVQREIVDGDIKLFFNMKLKNLSCWKTILEGIPSVIEGLTNVSAGLFIYAYTIFKFLEDYPDHAVHVLEAILSGDPSSVAFSLENLDKLYLTVLTNALEQCFKIPGMREYIRVVLGSLALLQNQVSTNGLTDLIDVEMRFIRDILKRLGSIILTPDKDDVQIRMLHASFPQFLVDKERCTDPNFYINPSSHHERLALTCLKVMTARFPLKRNICKLNDPTMMKSDIPDLQAAVKKCIQPSLQYSCIHWTTHLSKIDNPDQDILDAVTEFMRMKLLVWVEVLSYMNELDVAVPAMLVALTWCKVCTRFIERISEESKYGCKNHMQDGDKNEIVQLINDTYRLVLRCYTPISECPEHLYISGLTLAPSCVLTTCYTHPDNKSIHTIIKSMLRDSAWGACLFTIITDAGQAMFSPDGKLIASGSSNGDVCIWDAGTGISKRTLTGHTKCVRCVAWAPDGEWIASCSEDMTIRVWNATSGAQLHTKYSGGQVYAIAWSRDGSQLVIGGRGLIEVWDIAIGKEMKRRSGINTIVHVLAISKDSTRAVTHYKRLQLWDIGCDKKKILKKLELSFKLPTAVFLHNDSQVAVLDLSKIYLWDLHSDQHTTKHFQLDAKIEGMAVSQSGDTLALSTPGRIHFFNTESWDRLGSIQASFRLQNASFSPDGHRLLTLHNNTIRMWDLSSLPQIMSSTPLSSPHVERIHFVTISLDGSRVAAVSSDAVSIWSLESASLFCIIRENINHINITFSPDGQKIAVVYFDEARIWDISKNEPTLLHEISVNGLITWSPNGRWIAGLNIGREFSKDTLYVFGMAESKAVAKHERKWLSDIEFSHDGTMIYMKHMVGEDEIYRWEKWEKVDFEQHRWEIETDRRVRLFKDGWIVREEKGIRKRLCWVDQVNPQCIAQWGNYFVVGRDSGHLDILYVEDSSTDSTSS